MENAPESPFLGDTGKVSLIEDQLTLDPEFLSMVDLRLIEGENGTHYHWNPIVEFYNECHDGDGKFCSGPGSGLTGQSTLPDKDGNARATIDIKAVPRGKRGGSLIDPHEGTKTIDGVRGYDAKGKPVPGTDAWLEAHGIDKKTFNGRPYVKYEADRGDPALAEAYADYPQADRFFKKGAEQEGQQGGYIMIKHPIPGTKYGPVPPQIRPNKDLVTDQRVKAQKEAALKNAVARMEVLQQTTGPQHIRERKEKLKQAELNLERIKTATPEKVRQEAQDNLTKAHEGLKKARESGSPDEVIAARKNLASVQRTSEKEMRRADRWDPEHELYDAETSVKWAKVRLERAQADPQASLAAEIRTQGTMVKKAENAVKHSAAKYVFAPGTTVARMEMHPDPQNVKNLTEGKGRIYFAMEGSIKNDAILTSLKREDPTAAVVNVPSVTLWQEKGGNAGEIKWFAEKYGKGREVVLIPDADGITNPAVMQQANGMSAALKTFGFSKVILAAPPLKPGTKYVIDKFALPSGKPEERKGVDDHLGAGRGTLGQLEYTMNVKLPSYDLSAYGKDAARAAGLEKGMNKNAIPHTEKALAAISSIVGPLGTARITKNILAQASGLPATSAKNARDRLEDLGIISVEHIFDEQALSRGKRIRNPKVSDARVADLIKMGVIGEPRDQLYTDAHFDQAPVITLRDSRFLIKHTDVETGTLSELSTWNPPPTFKGWTSAVTRKKDTTGIAAKQVQSHAKTAAKREANKALTHQIAKEADVQSYLERKVAAPGRRLVRTKAGAERYGVPIGSPIPLVASAIQGPTLVSMTLLSGDQERSGIERTGERPDLETREPDMGFRMILGLLEPTEIDTSDLRSAEFYNSCHGEDGKFCPTPGGEVLLGNSVTGSKATGTKATGTKATGTKATGTKATGTKATGTKATGSDGRVPSKTQKIVEKILTEVLDDLVAGGSQETHQRDEGLSEFYNSCHGPDGKFCPTHGGKGTGLTGRAVAEKTRVTKTTTKTAAAGTGSKTWPKSTGREVTQLAGKKFGTVTVDGVKAKAVYEVTAANGNQIRLFDRSGKAGPYVSDLLNNHAKMNEMYPLEPTRHLIVASFKKRGRGTFAFVQHNSRFTYVNSDRLGFDLATLRPGFQMPSSQTGNTRNHDYILTHEYGHHVDFSKNVVNGVYIRHPHINNRQFQTHMSRYGNSGPDTLRSIESYAEAFGEWHHSNGKTKNPAALALAKSEKWYGTPGFKSSKPRKKVSSALGFEPSYPSLFETVANGLVQFALETDSEEPMFNKLFSFTSEPEDVGSKEVGSEDVGSEDVGSEDVGSEFEIPAPGEGGIWVADDFEQGQATIGDFESRDSSGEEIAEADAIMQQILGELEAEITEGGTDTKKAPSGYLNLANDEQGPGITEFYNDCHGAKDGRFCEDKAGGGGPKKVLSGHADLDSGAYDEMSDYDSLGDSILTSGPLWHGAREKLSFLDNDRGLMEGYNQYIDSDGHAKINKHLRPSTDGVSQDLDSQRAVDSLDVMFQQTAVPTKGISVFRGVGSKLDQSLLVPGNVIQDDGYLSTTIDPRVAQRYLDNNTRNFINESDIREHPGAIFHIQTKADTVALPGTVDSGKYEFLLNRGTALQINTVASDLKTRNLIVNAEVV